MDRDGTRRASLATAGVAVTRYPTAEVIESDQAVSFLAVRESTDFVGWVTAAGISVAVPARLARPLGKRVVVDLAGHGTRTRTSSQRVALNGPFVWR